MKPIITFFFACIFLLPIASVAQTPIWGFPVGGAGTDMSRVCKVAPNGNVCIAGKFTGTMDLNPGPGVYNVTSNGLDDIFVACYTSSGSFLWGFNVGGPNNDAAWYLTIDAFNNVIICGYHQSAGIDFDPGTGFATIGFMGGTGAVYGDGFVAKYTSTGAFVWAKDLGGSTQYDVTVSLGTDPLGCVYVGGVFNTSMTVSSSITFSSASAGTAYLIKYDAAGNVVWGHNYGLPGTAGVDCFPRSLEVSNGSIYVGGFYQGTSNFHPWGAPATLTSVGTYDAYIAKYDTAGNFIFVKNITGSGYNEEVGSLTLDASENIYITGYTTSPALTFNTASPGTSTVTAPGGGVGGTWDIFIAKYNSAGLYQWGKILGSTGNDYGMSIDVNGAVYCTGQFSNTVDFDPSPSIANLTSAGGVDIYVAKYDVSGNYLCAFRVGSAAYADIGYGLAHDTTGNEYTSGQFGGTAIDFDPTAATFPLTAAGGTDAYLVKYNYTAGTAIAGSLAGDTICSGDTAWLTITTTSGGSGPFTVTYTNGGTTYTVTGVSSGVPFPILPSPVTTTTYTVTSVVGSGASVCTAPPSSGFGSATVIVNPTPGAITGNVPLCAPGTLTLSNTATGGTWSISPVSVASISPTGVVTAISTGTATVTYSTLCGSVTAVVTVNAYPGPITGNTPMCLGSNITLSDAASGGTWSISPATVATISPTGVVTSISPGTATVTYTTPCGTVSAVVTVNASSGVIAGNTPICAGSTLTLTSSPAGGAWSSAPASVATITATGVVTGVSAGTATIIYTAVCGTVTAIVTVNVPPAAITGNSPVCAGSSVTLSSATPGGTWSISPMSVATISPTGVVTGVSNGTATISYTTTCGAATAIFTVSNTLGSITGNAPLCVGQMLTLGATTGGGTWSSGTVAVATISATGTVAAMSAGTAMITYTTACGPAYAVVTVNNTPIVTATADTPCEGGILDLSATAAAGATYYWTGPLGFSSGSPTAAINPAGIINAGTYFVTATVAGCTSLPFPVVVAINPLPVITNVTSGNPSLCLAADGWLRLNGLNAGESYTVNYLYNGATVTTMVTADAGGSVLVSGLAAGTYANITVTSSAGCPSAPVGPVIIRFPGITPPVVTSNQPLCEGQTLFLLSTPSVPGGTFSWSFPDGGGSAVQDPVRTNVPVSASGIYTLTYTVDTCPVTATTNVTVFPNTVLYNVTHNQIISYGESVQLNANGALYYLWTGDGTITNPFINNPVVNPMVTTVYTVYGMNEGGCADTATVTVTLNEGEGEFVPSAFTPNGDGMNDIFKIYGIRFQKLIEFSIYNRWGERVYYNGYSPKEGWDGTYNGVLQDMGVYNYYIRLERRNGDIKIYKGDVTLIR